MTYKIIINYTIDDLKSSYSISEELTTHSNITFAKENIERIKKHYIFLQNYYGAKTPLGRNDCLLENQNNVWFSNKQSLTDALYNICLLSDKGNELIINLSHYNEIKSLNKCEIIICKSY